MTEANNYDKQERLMSLSASPLSSSFDDTVTSSDQLTEPKPKKKYINYFKSSNRLEFRENKTNDYFI